MNTKERFPMLDIFRTAICVMVLFFHGVIHGYWIIPQNNFIYFNIRTGAVYMDAFFMLSGFLLFYLYFEKFMILTVDNVKSFIKKRLIRIYPLYIFYVLTIFIYDKYWNLAIIPTEILCLQGFFPAIFNRAGNGGTWFISCMMFSYLMFPMLCWLVNSTKKIFSKLFILYALIVYICIFCACFKLGWVSLYINP